MDANKRRQKAISPALPLLSLRYLRGEKDLFSVETSMAVGTAYSKGILNRRGRTLTSVINGCHVYVFGDVIERGLKNYKKSAELLH
jgi:hypothetical protein